MGARVAWPAVALVRPLRIATDPVVADGRAGRTLVHILRAVEAGEAGRTGAAVLAHQVSTRRAVATRLRRTLVNVLRAGVALEAGRTPTLVALHQVHAEVVGGAGHAHAVVNVHLAVGPRVAGQAGAGELERRAAFLALLDAGGAVQAGAFRTGVVGCLATQAHVPEIRMGVALPFCG